MTGIHDGDLISDSLESYGRAAVVPVEEGPERAVAAGVAGPPLGLERGRDSRSATNGERLASAELGLKRRRGKGGSLLLAEEDGFDGGGDGGCGVAYYTMNARLWNL
ncbi:uncharacterized protein A4U43_C08F35760 [Asparagus officinalis]|nr:uncharacterized protein A4U43_C08F35760 [Asparagus officinalis]